MHPIYGDAIVIPLRGRDGIVKASTIIDRADAALADRRWHLLSKGYAVGYDGGVKVLMHRVILGLASEDSRQGDHIDRNRLDNRRSNLRIATNAENRQNVGSYRGSSSRFRGVSWYRRRGCWTAQAKIGYRSYWLGRFPTEEEAAAAVAAFRAEHMPFANDEVAA